MSTTINSAVLDQSTAPNGVKLPVYMDNHATTPLDPRVLDEMPVSYTHLTLPTIYSV